MPRMFTAAIMKSAPSTPRRKSTNSRAPLPLALHRMNLTRPTALTALTKQAGDTCREESVPKADFSSVPQCLNSFLKTSSDQQQQQLTWHGSLDSAHTIAPEGVMIILQLPEHLAVSWATDCPAISQCSRTLCGYFYALVDVCAARVSLHTPSGWVRRSNVE